MKKTDFIGKVTERASETLETKLTKKHIDAVMDAICSTILDALTEDPTEKIEFGRLGTFRTKAVPEKSGVIRLPGRKDQEWTKPAHNALVFKVNSAIKDIE
jgi:bacterial DNA-binding protein|nr:MAG TPA: Bacterial DNA-binding protein [Caudoviricetes sp.]